jgi:DNA-binding transcriptional MerR regulator
MQIRDLAHQTRLSEKTIRFYESVGLLPPPRRRHNGYREYDDADVERAKFVAGARHLDLSLDDIREILAMRDNREAPCRTLLNRIEQKANEIKDRIRALQKLEWELQELYSLGQTFPVDDVDGKDCICHLVSERSSISLRS